MSSLGALFVTLEGDSSSFDRAMDNAEERMRKVERGGVLLSKAIDVAFSALNKVADVAMDAARAFAAQEQATFRQEAALRAMNQASAEASEALQLQADRMEKLTGIDDVAIQQAQTLAISYGKTASQAYEMTEAAAALSAVTGQDLNASMMTLIKSLDGTLDKTLKYLPATRDLTEEQLRSGGAVKQISKLYGDLASTKMQGASGAVETMAVAWENMTKAVIAAINSMRSVINVLSSAAHLMTAISEMASADGAIGGIGTAFAAAFGSADMQSKVADKLYAARQATAKKEQQSAAAIAGTDAAAGVSYSSTGGGKRKPAFEIELGGGAWTAADKAVTSVSDDTHAAQMASFQQSMGDIDMASEIESAIAEANGIADAFVSGSKQATSEYLVNLQAQQRAAEEAAHQQEYIANIGFRAAASMGDMGSAITSSISAFQQGGPLAAAATAFLALASKSVAFQKIVGHLNKVFEKVVQAIEPLLAALSPVLEVVGEFAVVLMTVLEPVFRVVAGIMEGVGVLLKGLFLGLAYLFKGLASLWNGIVGAFASFFKTLGGWEIFGKKPLGFLYDFGKALEKGKVNMDGLNDAIYDMNHDTAQNDVVGSRESEKDAIDGVTGAMDDFGSTVDDVNASLTNVPQGFKVAQYRYAAAEGESPFRMEGGSMGGNTVIANIQVMNPREAWDMIKKESERDNYKNRGTVARGGPYSTSKAGMAART